MWWERDNEAKETPSPCSQLKSPVCPHSRMKQESRHPLKEAKPPGTGTAQVRHHLWNLSDQTLPASCLDSGKVIFALLKHWVQQSYNILLFGQKAARENVTLAFPNLEFLVTLMMILIIFFEDFMHRALFMSFQSLTCLMSPSSLDPWPLLQSLLLHTYTHMYNPFNVSHICACI